MINTKRAHNTVAHPHIPFLNLLNRFTAWLAIPLMYLITNAPLHANPSMQDWNRMLDQLSISDSHLIRQEKKKEKTSEKEETESKKEDKNKLTPAEQARKDHEEDLIKNHKKYTKKLYKAVRDGDIEKVREYILKKADVNYAKRKGVTLLHIAAANGDLTSVRMLVANGANVEAETTKQWSPLHHAARFGHLEVVRFLMSKGANMYLANSDGKNPYALARQLKHDEIINFFQIWRKYH